MSSVRVHEVLLWVWGLFGLYWVASALRSSPNKTREPQAYRVLRLFILVVAFVLLLSPWLRRGPLAWRFVPNNLATRFIGLSLILAGVALAVWARIRLGKYWSDKVVLKRDHQLVRSGPYAFMRHPIYSGVLLGVAGTALAAGEWRGIVALCLLLSAYAVKARKEERVLAGTFGDVFGMYQQQTGFFIPRFHRRV